MMPRPCLGDWNWNSNYNPFSGFFFSVSVTKYDNLNGLK